MAARTLDDVALAPTVLAHYERVGGFMEASFGGEPIMFANFPAGFDQPPHFTITDVPLQARKLLWLVHRNFALEFHGWAPLAGDEFRLRFARILLECGPSMVVRADAGRGAANAGIAAGGARRRGSAARRAQRRCALDTARRRAAGGAVRAWLHPVCDRAVERYPELVTTEPNTVDCNRVHLHVSSNARHRYSALPYSLRGGASLQVCTPVTWDELKTAEPYAFVAATSSSASATRGTCSREKWSASARGGCRCLRRRPGGATLMALDYAPRGHVILAAIAILEDGKTRSADEILHEALERKAIPPRTTRKYVYTALIEYIARQIGRGHRPQIVQDARRNFRINEPPDDWPDLVAYEAPTVDAQTDALIARLEKTSRGPGSEAFEIACCDTFAHLGFRAQRFGQVRGARRHGRC